MPVGVDDEVVVENVVCCYEVVDDTSEIDHVGVTGVRSGSESRKR